MKIETKTALATACLLVFMGATSILSLSGGAPKAAVRALERVAVQSVREPIGRRELIVPIKGVSVAGLVDTWGAPRDGGRYHEGIDIIVPAWTPVRAAASGTIVKLFSSSRGGVTVYQRDASGRLILYYAHLNGYVPGLREGMRVKQGQDIAFVGQTGNATVPHLHFEVQRAGAPGQWWRAEAVNPYLALRDGRVGDPVQAQPAQASLGGRGHGR
ncbi:MAG: M23 family metallopeptidase [Alphaproteobacteria bacterium]|jgi:murein DD-endopeptidase MepM/ murein hydrolase activator NlpD|nr:M23 family metallopeptidase [Alphaproteobacteria bacterium]